MPRFDLSNYQDVQSRLNALHKEYPDARIITENLTSAADRVVLTWVVKATLFLTAEDQSLGLAKASGHAFEIDGGQGANLTSALENAETSAVGRCLRLAGIGNGPSAEEMAKVNRGKSAAQSLDSITEVTELRRFYAIRKAAGASEEELATIQERARLFDSPSENKGTGRSGKGSKASKESGEL
jgi:hypothetical protein